ncbi:MAG: UrcA family protein [Janthinobacterium lividum]
MIASLNQTVARTIVGTVGTALFATVCLLAAAGPAHAATVATAATQVVSYRDLDLSTDAGRATLTRRIASAAKLVCISGGSDLSLRTAQSRCVRNAISGAQPKTAAVLQSNAG